MSAPRNTSEELPEISSVNVYTPHPGDVLLVTTPQAISEQQAETVKRKLRSVLDLGEDLPICVISDGIQFNVVRPKVAS